MVCVCACRAWALTDNKSWQTCLLKRICLYGADEFEQISHSTAGPAPPNKHLPSSAAWCKSRQIKKQAAKAHKWALHNADLISLDTKALQDLQGAVFIPDVQFSFSSNVHFTLYRYLLHTKLPALVQMCKLLYGRNGVSYGVSKSAVLWCCLCEGLYTTACMLCVQCSASPAS